MNWLAYYWKQTKGYRLRPWRSPYIRWRAETYWGGDMSHLTPARLFRLAWQDRAALSRFFAWAEERQRAQRRGRAAVAVLPGAELNGYPESSGRSPESNV